MTSKRHSTTGPATAPWARLAALPALALAVSVQAPTAQAQAVQDYRLPPASPSPRPTAAGPVDSDHPVAAPTATPAPAPSPAVTLPPPAAAPTAEARATATPRAERSPRAQARPEPEASPATASATPVPPPVSSATVEAVPAPAATPTPPLAPPPQESYWPWLAGAAVLALMSAAFWLLRRRKTADASDYEPFAPAEASPQPSPPAALTPPRPQLPPPALPPLAAEPRPLEMQLEARHLSRAMINATLAYRLTLTNRADSPTGPLRIAGDIVSAHASLSAEEQLAPGGAALAAIHEVPSLAPGESVSLSGELRLPLASILPIHSGGNRVFVPLARFRADAQGGGATTRIFVIGQASDRPGGALRPFPLDRGPGIDRALGQRELEMPL